MKAMKVNALFMTALAAAAFAMASCTHDDTMDGGITTGRKVTVDFSYTIADMAGDGPEAAGQGMESRTVPPDLDITDGPALPVKNMWIIQFEGTNPDSKMLGAPSFFDEADMGGQSANPFPVLLIETTADAYTLFIANMAGTDENFQWNLSASSTFTDVMKRVKTLLTENDTYESFDDGATKTLLVSGVTTDPVVSGGTLRPTLKRNVAKVTLNLSVAADQTGLQVKSVRLRNIPNKIAYADIIAERAPDYYADNIATFDNAAITDDALLPSVGSSKTFSWYVPRNMRGTSRSASTYDKTALAPAGATYFEIVAVKGDITTVYTVYPGANNTDDYNIKPNTHYKINLNIAGINADPNDSRATSFTNVVEFMTDKGKRSNSFILNPVPAGGGARRFRIPITQVNRYWGNSYPGYGATPANVIGPNDYWEVALMWSDYPGGNNGGITLSKSNSVTGTASDQQYFEITVPAGTPPGNFVVYLRKTEASVSSDPLWSWHFWVTDYNPDRFNRSLIEPDTYTYHVPGGQVERYADYNTTLWGPGGDYAGKVMMDRYMGMVLDFNTPFSTDIRGALHYQYGRKDPFPASSVSETGITFAANPVIISESVTHPTVLYNQGNDSKWNNDTGGGYEWNDPATTDDVKSIYDPCPPGWRIPRRGTWNDFARQSEGAYVNVLNSLRDLGWTYGRGIGSATIPVRGDRYWPGTSLTDPVGGTIWYPCYGSRQDKETGVRGDGNGWVWANIDGWMFDFGSTHVLPDYAHQQKNAFSVRCISD